MKTKKNKSDFVIKGKFTGSQIRGKENEFKYHVYYKGMQVDADGFTNKAKAEKWLSALIDLYNSTAE